MRESKRKKRVLSIIFLSHVVRAYCSGEETKYTRFAVFGFLTTVAEQDGVLCFLHILVARGWQTGTSFPE